MIATSARSARRATVRGGTIGLAARGGAGRLSPPAVICPTSSDADRFGALVRRRLRFTRVGRAGARELSGGPEAWSVIEFDMAAVQHEAARIVLFHERQVMSGNDHRGAEAVELDEEAQEPAGEGRVDVAGWFVGE